MIWFYGWKVKGQGRSVNKCIFRTNDYYTYVSAHLTHNTAIRRGFVLYECLLVQRATRSTIFWKPWPPKSPSSNPPPLRIRRYESGMKLVVSYLWHGLKATGGSRGGAVGAIAPPHPRRLVRQDWFFFTNFQQNISLIRLFPAFTDS